MIQVNKVAFLCHPYHRGGVTRWMADAAMYFAQIGWEVYFAAPNPTVEFFSARGRESMITLLNKDKNVRLISLSAGREFEFGTSEYRTYIYKKLLLQLPLGIPVIVSDDSCVWDAACSLSSSFPVVGVLHADDKAYYNLATKYLANVAVFVSVSQRVETKLKQACPSVADSRLFVIPCGIYLPDANTGLGVKESDTVNLLYVGRIEREQKRTEDLVTIAELLQRKNVPFSLKIIGDGVDVKSAMETEIAKLGLQQQVTFTGWLSQQDVLNAMNAADILMLTSNYEGMPISMMEALACGCGFVGTRVSGIEDYEHHVLAPDCFRVFEVGELEVAVKQIQDIASIPKRSRRKAATELAKEQFSMQTCIANYIKAFSSIPLSTDYKRGIASIGVTVLLKSFVLSYIRFFKMVLRNK